jgi:hypothetical protein
MIRFVLEPWQTQLKSCFRDVGAVGFAREVGTSVRKASSRFIEALDELSLESKRHLNHFRFLGHDLSCAGGKKLSTAHSYG